MCISDEDPDKDSAALLLFCEKGARRSVSFFYMVKCILVAMGFGIEECHVCHAHQMMQRCQNPTNATACTECVESNEVVRQVGDAAVSEFFEIVLAADRCFDS
jgi:hypothetical protein